MGDKVEETVLLSKLMAYCSKVENKNEWFNGEQVNYIPSMLNVNNRGVRNNAEDPGM